MAVQKRVVPGLLGPVLLDEVVVTAKRPWWLSRQANRASDFLARRAPKLGGRGGGFYGDFGIGLGPGFNLHFDRRGLTGSVGGGLFGRAQVGYALSEEALDEVTKENRFFAGGKLGSGLEAGGNWAYDGDFTGSLGPAQVQYDRQTGQWKPGLSIDVGKHDHAPGVGADDKAVTFGFDGGIGWLHTLGSRRWNPPGS